MDGRSDAGRNPAPHLGSGGSAGRTAPAAGPGGSRLAPELAAWLEALRRERNGSSERVVLSDRDQQPLAAQSISRLARAALDAGDLKAVRLIDLRHDYVLRQLERHDWQYVSRITGLEAAAMNVHFAAYLTEKKVSTRIRRKAAPQIDEFALWKLLQAGTGHPRRGGPVAHLAAGAPGGGDRRSAAVGPGGPGRRSGLSCRTGKSA